LGGLLQIHPRLGCAAQIESGRDTLNDSDQPETPEALLLEFKTSLKFCGERIEVVQSSRLQRFQISQANPATPAIEHL
jgi:hypothetical protein